MVEVIIPPTMGAAIGFITSEPMPVSQRIGTRLASTARDRHQLGPEPLHRAFDGGLLNVRVGQRRAGSDARLSSASCRYTTMTTPVSTAMPNSAM